MEVVARILKSTVAGVALGAVLTTVVFAASVLVDGGRVGEAFGFGLAIGVVGALLGGLIGLAAGALKLGPIGGALAGIVATLAAVAFYVLVFGQPGRFNYFLRESVVVVATLGLPCVLTGILTGRIATRLRRDEHLSSARPQA